MGQDEHVDEEVVDEVHVLHWSHWMMTLRSMRSKSMTLELLVGILEVDVELVLAEDAIRMPRFGRSVSKQFERLRQSRKAWP